jgi:hypothetical protein
MPTVAFFGFGAARGSTRSRDGVLSLAFIVNLHPLLFTRQTGRARHRSRLAAERCKVFPGTHGTIARDPSCGS